jgi:hypothetical protein
MPGSSTPVPATHQTVRLGWGKHLAPEHGACVVELASMLAGEPFSDRPQSVCPFIGAFLRAYNDALDDRRRQDLYPVASAVVGTETCRDAVVAERIGLLARWGRERASERPRLWPLPRPYVHESQQHEVGIHAVRAIRRIDDRVHASALALIDELVAVGRRGPRVRPDGPIPWRERGLRAASTTR